MKIDDIMEMWSKDCTIDKYAMDDESLNIPVLHNKYLKIWSQERMRYHKYNEERKTLRIQLTEYYNGDLNNKEDLEELNLPPFLKTLTKNQVEQYVDANKDMINVNYKVFHVEEKLKYLESVLKSINNRHWTIRNAIEFQKFTQGA